MTRRDSEPKVARHRGRVGRRHQLRSAQHPATEISGAVQCAREKFAQSTIRDFVPLFVERNAAFAARPRLRGTMSSSAEGAGEFSGLSV
ncbi:three-helix bundle dimerization domain-containing protein [Mycolicibacterium komossense]|uniref:three-helix bundle dimerization domain-containing protein n=1 Tax=Mycolicibacterium komossense TaxID=1779 RepID=UPI003F498C4D